MARVDLDLYESKVKSYELISRASEILERDEEVQELLRMSNIFAVSRLRYNDHGPVHARIVSGAALEIFDLLISSGIQPTSLRDRTTSTVDEARLIVFLGAYLHDIGNSIHRSNHEMLGAIISRGIVDRILGELMIRGRKAISIRQEILHAIYSTEYSVKCLSVEAGIVKIADGTDMSMGRARIPYKMGKIDMHSMSALSVKSVDIERGSSRPVRIVVTMNDYAGLFQIEEVLMPKIMTSLLEDHIEVWIQIEGKLSQYYPTMKTL
ncbi:MAG: HD domain-containing protein [Sulfolobales archaeon]